jgi:DNA-directed RNA polymerase sigma subunit (sigma70/sigma32)
MLQRKTPEARAASWIRALEIRAARRSGMTLIQIGATFNLSHERVRQILLRTKGIAS